ncbi:MAG TPA: hypothetical protein VFD39_10775, partial [Trueperaceae bacterium]|nr:hypothetical protein [Trueperaceae bacterium]
MPVYRDPTNVPRDLRSAGQLAAGGYQALGPVVAWLEVRQARTLSGIPLQPQAADRAVAPTQATRRVALHSTSEARKLEGYTWSWPQRGAARAASPPAGGKAAGSSTSARTAAGARAKPRVLNHHTPLLARRKARPSLNVEPRRWLTELFREGFVVID